MRSLSAPTASLALLASLVGCSPGTVATTHGDGGGSDAAAHDAGTTGDASTADLGGGTDLGGATDLGAGTDLGAATDLGVGIDACVPRTICNPGECGNIPAGDDCGGVLACADACTDGDIYCTVGPSMNQAAVTGAVNQVMAEHPELFDPVMFRDTSSWLVIDDAGYTAAVVAACNAMGVVCISDPNDDHEIRVHGPGDHRAENYGIRVHSSNRTWTRFMGGFCETTAF